jgi:hypothetical protein
MSLSLKDLQPRISQALPSLLAELKNPESESGSIQAINLRRGKQPFNPRRFRHPKSLASKYCRLCTAEGRSSNHSLADCHFISVAEKRALSASIRFVDITDDPENSGVSTDPIDPAHVSQ